MARPNIWRANVFERLRRIFGLATATGQVERFIVFGSFITSTPRPNDVDVFMVMADSFDVSAIHGEQRILFEHGAAQDYFGASVSWIRRAAIFGDVETMVLDWGTKRDGSHRGVVEVVGDDR
jgi:hypothetical protein